MAQKGKKGTTADADTQQDTGDAAAAEVAAQPGDAGTQQDTGAAAPEMAVAGPAAAPLDPPNAPVHPEGADPQSSTNPVAASAAVQTMPGDAHVRIVTPNPDYRPGDQGADQYIAADPDRMFTDPGGHATFMHTSVRLLEEFRHNGARGVDRRLLYAPGQPVSRARAHQLRQLAARAGQEPTPAPDGD